MKKKWICIIVVLFVSLNLFGQEKCDSCLIFKQKYFNSGDLDAYNKYIRLCTETNTDTLYYMQNEQIQKNLKGNKYTLIVSENCTSHKFIRSYMSGIDSLISEVELYNNDTVYVKIDTLAAINSGYDEYHSFVLNYHLKNITGEKSKGGIVYVSLLILENGKIECIKILRGVDQYLDSDALRYFGSMPDWRPANKNGRKVKCRVTFPWHVAID